MNKMQKLGIIISNAKKHEVMDEKNSPTNKKKEREDIEKLTKEFLKKGGEIEKCEIDKSAFFDGPTGKLIEEIEEITKGKKDVKK